MCLRRWGVQEGETGQPSYWKLCTNEIDQSQPFQWRMVRMFWRCTPRHAVGFWGEGASRLILRHRLDAEVLFSFNRVVPVFCNAGKNLVYEANIMSLISKRWLICDSLSALQVSLVFYVIQTHFDNSMKFIKHIQNTESCPLFPAELIPFTSVGFEFSGSLLCASTARNVKKHHVGTRIAFFIEAVGLSSWSQTILLMNVAAESIELKK